MTEEQYRLLTHTCDQVLLSPESTEERTAIPWLHVLREHPVILSAYEYLFDSTLSVPRTRKSLSALLRAAVIRVKQALWPARSRPQAWPGKLPQADILIVSHLLNPAFIGKGGDFYFGNVPGKLQEKGLTIVIALINHTDAAAAPASVWEDGITRVVLQGGGRKSHAITERMCRESRSLEREAKRLAPGLLRRVFEGAAREARSPEAAAALSIGEDIAAVAEASNAKSLVITHEGHAWERIAFSAARRLRPGIKCIGYNQACLFPLQHALKRNLFPRFNPDHILTAGRVTKEMLENAPDLSGVRVSVLGSDRGLLHAEAPGRPAASCRTGQPVCLVIPEGILSECGILFEFSRRAALAMPDVSFRWRLHPVLSFDSVFERYPLLRNLPENVFLSSDSLEQDFASSQWALYRGTTAVIKAVLEGLRPVYVQLPGELSIDPLFGLSCWRRIAVDPADFKVVVAQDLGLQNDSEASEFLTAHKYCADYFSAFNADALALAARA